MTTHTATAHRTATADKAGRYTYVTNLPDGTVDVRNAKREFTHAVLLHNLERGSWRVHGMAGSAELAAKSAAFYGPWAEGTYSTLIIPVEVAK